MSGFLTQEQAEVAWAAMASVLEEIGATRYLSERWLKHPTGLKQHFVKMWTGQSKRSEEFFLASAGISKLYPMRPNDEDTPFIHVLRQPDRHEDLELARTFRDRITEALETMK